MLTGILKNICCLLLYVYRKVQWLFSFFIIAAEPLHIYCIYVMLLQNHFEILQTNAEHLKNGFEEWMCFECYQIFVIVIAPNYSWF